MACPSLDDFLEELYQQRPFSNQTRVDAVWSLTTKFFALNGFDKLILIHREPDNMILLSSLPPEWVARYHDQGYAQIDPFFSYCGTTFRPISTGVAYSNQHKGLTRAQTNLIVEAGEFGINAGFSSTVNLLGPNGFAGWNIGSSLSGKEVDRLRSDREETLRFAARHAYDVLMQPDVPCGGPNLSSRERECLTLLACGLRTKDIARRLSISPAAIELYVRNARAKLGAATREQAVAVAIAKGLLGNTWAGN